MNWTKAHHEAFDKARWEIYEVIINDPCYHWTLSVDEVVSATEGKSHEIETFPRRDEAIAAGRALYNGVKTYEHTGDDHGTVWTVSDIQIPYNNFLIRGWRVDRKKVCE